MQRSDVPGPPRHGDLARPDGRASRRAGIALLGHAGGRCRSSSSTACSTARRRTRAGTSAGHGTAFKTRWMNEAVYQIACFMIMRDPTAWRWSHTRHHTDTIIVGRDPEIAAMRPARLARAAGQLLRAGRRAGRVQAHGRCTPAAGSPRTRPTSCPRRSGPRSTATARIWLAIYAARDRRWRIGVRILAAAGADRRAARSTARSCTIVYGLTQHAGLGENVLDHRLNTRTVYMNRGPPVPLLEHELPRRAPHVPDGALPPAARAARGDQARPARRSTRRIWAAYKEIIPAVLRQLRDEDLLRAPRAAATAPPVQRAARPVNDGRALPLAHRHRLSTGGDRR